MHIRKILLASAAAITLSTGAFAADLPGRAPAIAPAPVFVAMNWTGFYVGAQVGWSEGRDRLSAVAPAIIVPNVATLRSSGVIGGVYAGYNWQFNSLVVGLEADINPNSYGRTINALSNFNPFPAGVSIRSSSTFEGGLVGKVGVAFDNALLYVLGGVSFADFSTRYVGVAAPQSNTFNNTRVGWTIGAGAAYKFSPNWSARIEYRYSDFGSSTHAVPGEFLSSTFAGDSFRNRYSSQRVMVGLTYQFGGPAAAVVAKY